MNKGSVFCACCAVVALLVCGAFADAAQPSAAKMSQMGLSGAKVVSDSVAMEVRGMGYRSRRHRSSNRATIWGNSEVEVEVEIGPVEIEAEAENGYYATSNEDVSGENFSFVGIGLGEVENENQQNEVEVGAIVLFAGGSSHVEFGSSNNGHRGGRRVR